MSTWIDFKALRAELKFEEVLRRYGVELKVNKGGQHHGYCPLPTHEGKRNSPSFSAHLERGIFNCFGCGAKGNVLDFAVRMEGLNPENGADVRTTALKLQELVKPVESPKTPKRVKKKKAVTPTPETEPELVPKAQVVVNAPLNFELKNLDQTHPYLEKRGFEKETITKFGLGYCSKGLLAGRIAIPIHNEAGKLVGYAGRLADGQPVTEENPRYKFPPKREHGGVQHEFHKLHLLYNAHQLYKPVDTLVIVEGFPSVWWLTQLGISNVVALMGSTMSEEQAGIVERLVAPEGKVWAIPDGDEAGERCGAEMLTRIASLRFIRWLKLDEGKQPTDYPGGWYRERIKK